MADQQDTGGRHRRPDDGQAMDGVEYPTPKFHSVTEWVPAEEFHRYPAGSREPGYFSDELTAGAW